MRRCAVAAVVLVLALPGGATAARPHVSFADVEDEVMCVSCNVALNIAESPQADAERREIRRLIAQGRTKRQIEDALVAQYGPNVLALPQRKGVNWVAYLVPIVAFVAVLAAVLLALPRWRRKGADPPDETEPRTPDADLDPDDARRLDEDLARSGA